MLRITAWERPMAVGTPRKSPDMSTTSALSMAMSVPVPMAMPTSAAARAGASLMPSPTKATRPRAFSRAMAATLPSGSTSDTTSSMPSRFAMASAVRRLSPVIMATLSPMACSAAMVAGVVGFTGSATAMMAARRPSMAA